MSKHGARTNRSEYQGMARSGFALDQRDQLPAPIAKGDATREECIDLIMRVQTTIDNARITPTKVTGKIVDMDSGTGVRVRASFSCLDTVRRSSTVQMITTALADASLLGIARTEHDDASATLVIDYPRDIMDRINDGT